MVLQQMGSCINLFTACCIPKPGISCLNTQSQRRSCFVANVLTLEPAEAIQACQVKWHRAKHAQAAIRNASVCRLSGADFKLLSIAMDSPTPRWVGSVLYTFESYSTREESACQSGIILSPYFLEEDLHGRDESQGALGFAIGGRRSLGNPNLALYPRQ